MPNKVQGIIPPLTTPFTKEGDVYEEGLRELVEFQIEGGSHGLFICGTYGSGPVMTLEQRKRVTEIVVDQVKGRITVITHVGTASTAESVELAQHAEAQGVDLIASISPYYHNHKERAVLEHFRTLVNAVDKDVFVYNNPACSGVTISPSFLHDLADVGVAGVKDSGFSFVEFTHFVLELEDKPDFTFVVGTEGLALPAWLVGAKGCVSGLANAFPELMAELWDLYQEGKIEEAAKLQLRVNKARRLLHIPDSTNTACYAVLNERGVDVGYPKAPFLPVAEDKREAMFKGFREMGLL
ncbi:MAG: dihydrodipicolinate synthase family protein [Chloroflexota bacterium]|nr:dihydrodipicolinate synthase family protein [Chloroflexota bacterium]